MSDYTKTGPTTQLLIVADGDRDKLAKRRASHNDAVVTIHAAPTADRKARMFDDASVSVTARLDGSWEVLSDNASGGRDLVAVGRFYGGLPPLAQHDRVTVGRGYGNEWEGTVRTVHHSCGRSTVTVVDDFGNAREVSAITTTRHRNPEPAVPAGNRRVTFVWSTEHGDCYDCGNPAAYQLPDAYGKGAKIGPEHLRCSVCAARAAALDGERIVYLSAEADDDEQQVSAPPATRTGMLAEFDPAELEGVLLAAADLANGMRESDMGQLHEDYMRRLRVAYRRLDEADAAADGAEDGQRCVKCGDTVQALSSQDWCDGCEEQAARGYEHITLTLVLARRDGQPWRDLHELEPADMLRDGETMFFTVEDGISAVATTAGADPSSWPDKAELAARPSYDELWQYVQTAAAGHEAAAEQARRVLYGPDAGKRWFTVVGTRDQDGDLTVAGVVPGKAPLVDTHPGTAYAQRWADSFLAVGPQEAEWQAHEACKADPEDDEDEPTPLVWESAGTDESGDQNADSTSRVADDAGGAFWAIGPEADGRWSLALVQTTHGREIGRLLLGKANDEEGAKACAQQWEDSDDALPGGGN